MPLLNQTTVLRETVVPKLTAKSSLESNAEGVFLDNDLESPGNNKVYGTNSNGEKGWLPVTSGDGIITVESISELKDLTHRTDQIYSIASGNRSGLFYYDSSDTTSADNDGTIFIASNGNRIKRLVEGDKINAKWFGATGDGATDDTNAFKNAHTYCAANGKTLLLPKGTYSLSTLTSNTLGIISSAVSWEGESADSVTISVPDEIKFIGDLRLKNIKFLGNTTKYVFRYDTSGIPSVGADTVYKQLQVDGCVFENCKRAISMFHSGHANAPQNLVFYGSYVNNCTFNSVGEGGVMLRALLDGFTAFNNTFDGIDDVSTYNFCLSLGDTGVNNSRGVIISHNKFFDISPTETGTDDSTYVVIVYGAGNQFIGNSFYECTRGCYSRGNAGIISNNQFYNSSTFGTFPIICKAGSTGQHKISNNEFFGKFNRLILHDSTTSGIVISGNTGFIECADGGAANSQNLITIVSGGSFNFVFENNNLKVNKNVSKTFISVGDVIDTVIVTGNTIDSYWSTGSGGQFISYNPTGAKTIIIKDNPYLSLDTLLYSKASTKVVENNTFFQKPYFNGSIFYRSNGGTNERVINNSFYKVPGETYANNDAFDLLFKFTEGTSVLIENTYLELAPTTGLIYAANNTDLTATIKDSDLNGGRSLFKNETLGAVSLNIIKCQNYTLPLDEDVVVSETTRIAEAQADSTANDVAGLVTDFNGLLAKLRTAGLINT